MFDVFIFFLFSCSLAGVFGDVAVKSVSVMEGESVTLNIDINTVETVEKDDLIQWRFRHNFLIALMYRQSGEKTVHGDVLEERFRGRLELDQTGSLTITDTRTTDSGLYTVKISNNKLYTFSLTVYVVNVSAVSLSWFRGHSLLSSSSVSDLSISLSLPLEIVCLDDSYSCVLNNPISNQTTHLNTELCKPCPDDSMTVLISAAAAAAGFLLFAAAVGIFCICRKHRKTDQEETVQNRDREITYADPTFYKIHKSAVKQQDNVVYAGVVRH